MSAQSREITEPAAAVDEGDSPVETKASEEDHDAFKARAKGRFRFRQQRLSSFPLSDDGLGHGHHDATTALFRVGTTMGWGNRWYLGAQLQLLDGQFAGDTSTVGGDAVLRPWDNTSMADQVMLRELYLHLDVLVGALRIGRMQSHWGLGMLANSGDRDDAPFADITHGDVVNRALFVTKPLKFFTEGRAAEALHLMLGVDLIERDELTDRVAGDLAWQVVAAVAWQEDDLEVGTYLAHRHLTRESGDVTAATVFDLYARWELELAADWLLKLQLETAIVTGTTEEARFDGAKSPLGVLQHGGVMRAELLRPHDGLEPSLDIGWATGDNQPQDDTLSAFRFDPAYHVGMILFEEVLGRVSARGLDRASDPELAAVPQHGVRRLPTNGSITNTVYLYPQVVWRLFDRQLEARGAFLAAFAPADVTDGYASALVGGYNSNAFRKVEARGFLGGELNLGVRQTNKGIFGSPIDFSVGVQYGLFFPGPALGAGVGDDGEPVAGIGLVHKARFFMDLNW